MVSRPVDLAEVAAIRGDVASKSPMRAAASPSVGSLLSRLRLEEHRDTAADAEPAAPKGRDVTRPGVASISSPAEDDVPQPRGDDSAAARVEQSAVMGAASSERGPDESGEAAKEPETGGASDATAGALGQEGMQHVATARPTHGAAPSMRHA